MPIPCYLALTAAEFASLAQLPEKIAWMACHYSCYSTGLSNLPTQLPAGSLIIVNDRTPAYKHDPKQILEQLLELAESLKPDGFLLDFQRADVPLNLQVAQMLTEGLPCPVGVTAAYAQDLNCPVFLEPPPLHQSIDAYISPWTDREIWLEAALQTCQYTVTNQGCKLKEWDNIPLPEPSFSEPALFCRHHTELTNDSAIFTLQRTKDDLDALLSEPSQITRAIGLYQQLGAEKGVS